MLYIRVDMNDVIATGHVCRCIAIADAAREKGEDTTFILADEQAVPMLIEKRYTYIVMHTKWNDMDSELAILENIIEEKNIERMLIDSYQVTEHYLKILSRLVKTLYIDDINAFCYPVNGIVCYGNYWKKFSYSERYQDVKLFLGTEYMPLRTEFTNCREKQIDSKVKTLLLMSGGTDIYGVISGVLAGIDRKCYTKIVAICGRYDADYDMLCKQYEKEKNIEIYRNVTDIDQHMKNADVAVSAGGTTLYELCACGTPTITYMQADNQWNNVEEFQNENIMDYAGDVRRDNVPERVCKLLNLYENNEKLRQERSRKMQSLVDGRGAARIVEALKTL